jgi:hypothetical protein
MNWYKKILKYCQSVEEGTSTGNSYPAYGHTSVWDENKEPNYMWVFIDGRLEVKPETSQARTHFPAFRDMLSVEENVTKFEGVLDRYYSGRYETSTGIVTIKKPVGGVAEFRDIPDILTRRLKESFSNITQVLIY